MRSLFVAVVCLMAMLATVHGKLTKPDDCGSKMGCYSNCEGASCQFVVTWKSSADRVDFSLSLDIASISGKRYVALGLSKDDKMGEDNVTDCVMDGNVIVVSRSYNEGDPKYNRPVTDGAQRGLSDITGSSSGGVLRCSYSMVKDADLSKSWTLLVASGSVSNGNKRQHDELPSISPEEVKFERNEDISGVKKNVLVKVHGCLMVFAWIFCASIGIFLARFYKPMWPNSKVCDEKAWFSFHRLCMVLAFLFCAAGFVVIFVEVQDWSDLSGHSTWQKAHPYLGCIVTALAVLNPVMAMCRPHPEDDNRYIFNWAHWLVGTGAHILAALTIILGVTLDKASVPYDCVWVVVGWVCYQIAVVLLTELHECIIDDKGIKYYHDGALKDPKGSSLKKVILALHVIIITGLTVTCIVLVAVN